MSNEENKELKIQIDEIKIKISIWILDQDKALGRDGFSISFYKFLWDCYPSMPRGI